MNEVFGKNMPKNLSIINATKGKLPSLPFVAVEKLKSDILGKDYDLSLAFVSKKKSRELNKKYRKKDKPTNVLAFPLRAGSGELVMCPRIIESEAKKFDKTFSQFLGFLIIHGMLHLRGLKHGEKMEKLEKKYLSRTKFLI